MQLPDPQALARRAGRWLGAGTCAAPIIDLADDAGLLGALASLDGSALAGVAASTWLALGFFGATGVAIARIFAAHSPRGRRWFFAALLLPLTAYIFAAGLRISVVVAVIALAYAYVSWRFGWEEHATARG